MLDRRLDVALVAGEVDAHPQLRLDPLFRDELVAVVGPRHPWFGKRRVEPTAFAEQHLLADAGTLHHTAALGRALIAAGNVTPRKVTLVLMSGTVAIDMVRANLGITLLPRWTVETLGDRQLGMVRVGARGLWLRWALAVRAEEQEEVLRAFLAAIRLRHPRARSSRHVRAR
jgi:LysR family transcriptional regulator for metE and metH